MLFCSACQKICQGRVGSRPTTPNHFVPRPYPGYVPSPTNGWVPISLWLVSSMNSCFICTRYVPQGVTVIPGPPHSPGSNSYHQVRWNFKLSRKSGVMTLLLFSGALTGSCGPTPKLIHNQGKQEKVLYTQYPDTNYKWRKDRNFYLHCNYIL